MQARDGRRWRRPSLNAASSCACTLRVLVPRALGEGRDPSSAAGWRRGPLPTKTHHRYFIPFLRIRYSLFVGVHHTLCGYKLCTRTLCVFYVRRGRDARTHTLFLAELREFIRDTKPFSLHLRNSYGTRRNILKKEEDAKRFRKISLSSGQVILSVEAASSPSAPCPILMDKSSLGARSQWRSGGVGGWVGEGGGGGGGGGGAPHRARGRPHGVVPRSALGWR